MDLALLTSIIQVLNMKHVMVICPDIKLQQVKALVSTEARFIHANLEDLREQYLANNGLLLCLENTTDIEVLKDLTHYSSSHSWVVIGNNLTKLKDNLKVKINEEIYYMDIDTHILSEYYNINGYSVKLNLGEFSKLLPFQYIKKEGVGSFLDRRGNFKGLKLMSVTERQIPYVDFFKELNISNKDNSSQLVNIDTVQQSGLFVDFLHMMESDLNFTTEKFVRKDRIWGSVDAQGKWIGIVGSLVDGKADLAISSLAMTTERIQVVDFLPALTIEGYGVYVKMNYGEEELDWTAYVYPFDFDQWCLILISPLVSLLTIRVIQRWYDSKEMDMEMKEEKQRVEDIEKKNMGETTARLYNLLSEYLKEKDIEEKSKRRDVDQKENMEKGMKETVEILSKFLAKYWVVFSSCMGGQPDAMNYDNKDTIKIVLFTVFLTGNVLFMSYNATLTTGLAVRERKVPFTTLEGLLASNYRLIMKDDDIRTSSVKKGEGIFGELYRQKMEPEKSFFHTIEEAFTNLLSPGNIAYYGGLNTFRQVENYPECKIEILVISMGSAIHRSMVLPKLSPLFPFLKLYVIRQRESGHLAVLEKKWKNIIKPDCGQQDISLGLSKLVSLFVLLLVSYIASVVIYLAEKLTSKFKNFGN